MNPKFIVGGFIALAAIGGAFFTFRPQAPAPTAPQEHAAHAEESAHVELTAEQIANAGIKIEAVGPATIRETLPLYGVIVPNAERVRDVAARFPGTIRSVSKKIGDPVKQGETLAVVESNESLQAYPVQAPLAGVVIARNANAGEQTGDKVLFSVADLSAVWVELSLFPRDAAKAHVGQQVEVRSNDAGISGTGSIVYVSPVGTAASQTRNARVLLNNSDMQWAPGLYVVADVTLSESSIPLAIRNTALQTIDGNDSVFVKTHEAFEPRAVRLGRADNETSEILDGLKPGEIYATENSYILKAELGKGEASHEH